MHERPVEAPDSERINSLVSGAGYSKVHFDGLNTWWIDQAETGLARAFTTPPNCFDTVSPMEKYRIIRQLNEDVQKTTETNQILEQNMHQLQDSLDTLQQQQTDLLNSTSWKLTAPLRALCRLTKKYSLR